MPDRKNTLPPRRVLVVDDNKEVAKAAVMMLKSLGQNVRQANDGESALLIATTFEPEVVFVDLVMPGMDGLEVGRQLRALNPAKPPKIVALTAFPQPAFKDAAEWAGFDEYLVKPPSAEEFARVLAD